MSSEYRGNWIISSPMASGVSIDFWGIASSGVTEFVNGSSGITLSPVNISPRWTRHYRSPIRYKQKVIYENTVEFQDGYRIEPTLIYKDRIIEKEVIKVVEVPISGTTVYQIKEVRVMDYTSLSYIGATLVVCFIYDKFIRPRLTVGNVVRIVFRVVIWPFKKVIAEVKKAEEEITKE